MPRMNSGRPPAIPFCKDKQSKLQPLDKKSTSELIADITNEKPMRSIVQDPKFIMADNAVAVPQEIREALNHVDINQ